MCTKQTCYICIQKGQEPPQYFRQKQLWKNRDVPVLSTFSWTLTLLHFSLQSSHLNICYYHQNLHPPRLHPPHIAARTTLTIRYRPNVQHDDSDQQKYLQVDTCNSVQSTEWTVWCPQDQSVKYNHLGNALLHSLDEILCCSSNYRPLIPASTWVHDKPWAL